MLKIIQDLEIAKSTVLKHLPAEFVELPFQVKQQIKGIFGRELTPNEVVERIIQDVRGKGDTALLDYSEKIDKVKLSCLEVKKDEIVKAYEQIDKNLLDALNLAAKRIRSFHTRQKESFFAAFHQPSFKGGGMGKVDKVCGPGNIFVMLAKRLKPWRKISQQPPK